MVQDDRCCCVELINQYGLIRLALEAVAFGKESLKHDRYSEDLHKTVELTSRYEIGSKFSVQIHN